MGIFFLICSIFLKEPKGVLVHGGRVPSTTSHISSYRCFSIPDDKTGAAWPVAAMKTLYNDDIFKSYETGGK